jgi:hypothetical protein
MADTYGVAGTTSDDGADVAVCADPGHLTINLEYDAAAQLAPADFRNGIQIAADMLSEFIRDPITLNIGVGYGDIPPFGRTLEPGHGLAWTRTDITEKYSRLRRLLCGHASTPQVSAAMAALPHTHRLSGVKKIVLPYAEERALGLAPATNSTVDGNVGFATDIRPGQTVAIALHEIGHVLGRVPGQSVLSLFRYTSPGNHDFSNDIPGTPSYFSLDGGITKIADFDEDLSPSDFLNPGSARMNVPGASDVSGSNLTPHDPFNELFNRTTIQSLTAIDVTELGLLGYNIGIGNLLSGCLTPVEADFSDTLISNGLPQTAKSVLSFIADNNDWFNLVAADIAKQPVIQDLAKEATLAEQTPLNFFLAGGAAIIGPAINSEASAIETAFTIDTATRSCSHRPCSWVAWRLPMTA